MGARTLGGMATGDGSDVDRYRAVAQRLHAIAKPIRVLAALRWPESARDEFLAEGGDSLPEVEYPAFDERPIVEAVGEVRRSIYPGALVDDWLESTAVAIELDGPDAGGEGDLGVPRLRAGPVRDAAHALAVRPGDALRAGLSGSTRSWPGWTRSA